MLKVKKRSVTANGGDGEWRKQLSHGLESEVKWRSDRTGSRAGGGRVRWQGWTGGLPGLEKFTDAPENLRMRLTFSLDVNVENTTI